MAEPKPPDSTPPFVLIKHVENPRLMEKAAGTLTLLPWEEEHLQGCAICHAVLSVFVRLQDNLLSGSE